eukprot:TRINITY_DN1084_c10_g1_i1.p1 TRINITY_DN1084_c10_g1~~TRINITY_DN1084_c10_g1_i1.p1  ORF type:complete len:309 (+),score=116.20 TRINITY_DN1084_c10_g1_i1:88-1014(+)
MEEDDLDALLDDALDSYDKAKEEEDHRQEEKKKKKVEAPTDNDQDISKLLENALSSLSEGGGAEDEELKALVEQGLNLVNNSEGDSDEDIFKKCLGLLDSVTKEMGKDENGNPTDENDPLNPFIEQLQQSVAGVVKGMEEGAGEGGTEPQESTEQLTQLLQAMGGSSEQFMEMMNKNGEQSDAKMTELLKAMGGGAPGAGSEEEFGEMVKKLMGDEIPGPNGLDDLLKATGTNPEEIEKIKEELENGKGPEKLAEAFGNLMKEVGADMKSEDVQKMQEELLTSLQQGGGAPAGAEKNDNSEAPKKESE